MPFFFDHYPYTNFHNVNLDWVLQAVKAWGALVEENNVKFHNLEEAMTSFRTMLLGEWNTFRNETELEINQFEVWTQNYLRNLDVQDEINTKLDEMLSSGVLSPYFAPYIQSDVSDWLQNNITPTSPAIDASLTISGAGADARVTGNITTYLESEDENINEHLEYLLRKETYVHEITTSGIFTKLTDVSLSVYNGAINIDANSQADTYYFIAEHEMEIFFPSATTAFLMNMCVGETFDTITQTKISCSNPARYQGLSGQLPVSLSPAKIRNGFFVGFTIAKTKTQKVRISSISDKYSNGLGSQLYGMSDSIDNIKEGLAVVVKSTDKQTDISTFAGFTKIPNKSVSINVSYGIALDTNDNYDTYYMPITSTVEIYFGAVSSSYLAFAYGSNFTKLDNDILLCTEPTRKRKSENNLPTSNSKCVLHYGDIIAITLPKNATDNIYGIEQSYSYSDQLNALLSSIKNPMVVYDDTTIGTETERLNIYIPTGIGYIKYNFAHAESVQDNYDIWLLHPLKAVSDNLSERYPITTAGEFECAIKIVGASDFMGGSVHGDETLNSVEFFIDGEKITPSSLQNMERFSELRVIENSNLYDPTDGITLACVHGKEYIFTSEGLTINQVIIWQNAFSLDYSYLAMLPILKSVTDYVILNKDYVPKAFSDGYFNTLGSSSALSYKDSVGLSAEMSIPVWDMKGTNLTSVGQFRCTDNGGRDYNKQYYVCTGGGSVASGDVWRAKTMYKFMVNK